MDPGDTVRMVNQIADFFEAYPEEEAVAMVADHIEKFWAPRMRADLAAVLTSDAAATLSSLARKGAARAVAGPDSAV